jgi:carbamoyl-phosphate synthase small subunit
MKKKAILALEDGTYFIGNSFGAEGIASGEVVFNTAMTGYQEILTDPSYKGQIVTMTYPEIGNVGVNDEDIESFRPFLEGFVVKEYQRIPSNWRAKKTLDEYLKEHKVVGIEGIDTRKLTRHIRDRGAKKGVISTEHSEPQEVIELARNSPSIVGRDLVKEVTVSEPMKWHQGLWTLESGYKFHKESRERLRIIAYDFGIKFNILRNLVNVGFEVQVVPGNTPAEKIIEGNPDGIFLSNGPGDPEGVPYIINEVKKLIGVKPIFGICLGHQILALALNGKTFKLKFGHHGVNHPVKNLFTGRIDITVQNHGFAVAPDTLGNDIVVTHINLNDRTVEGMAHKSEQVFSVQYHPEASGGPHDSQDLFTKFYLMIKNRLSGFDAVGS